MFSKTGKLRKKAALMILTGALTLSLGLSQSALAVNAQSDKCINFSGYKYVSGNSNYNLEVFIDKSTTVDAGDFKVYDLNTSTYNTVTYYGAGTDKPTSASWYPTGTCAQLNIANLTANHEYQVTISHEVTANNGFTLGQMTKNRDFVFTFQVPDSNGNYSSTPAPTVTFYPANNATNVAWEANALMVTDRPMTIYSGYNGSFPEYINGAYTEYLDSTFDSNKDNSNDYAYTRQAMENTGNTWYYPETAAGTTSYAYSLNGGMNYELNVPEFDSSSGNISHTNNSFTTSQYDVPAKLPQPTVTTGTNSGEINVTVTAGSSSNYPIASDYNFYVCSDKYFFNGTATLTNSTPYHNTSTSFTYTITGLTPGANYYVAVAPVISSGYGEGGYSPASAQVMAHS